LLRQSDVLLLEVGPGHTLSNFAKQHPARQPKQRATASLPHAKANETDDYSVMLHTAGELWSSGVELDWHAFYGTERRRRISLPTYPFEQRRYWIEPGEIGAAAKPAATPCPAVQVAVAEDSKSATTCQPAAIGRELIAASLKSLFSQLSGLSVASIDSRTSFTELGFDSLFLTQVSLHALFLENLYPARVLQAGGGRLLRLHAPLTASSLVHHAEHVVLYGLGAVALFAAARAIERGPTAVRLALAAVGLAVLLVAFTNLEATRSALQLAYGWIPGGACIAAILLATRHRRVRESSAALALTVALAIAGGTTYAAFYLHAPRAQTAVYFAPLAAVFLAGLHLRALGRSRTAVLLGAGWLAFLGATGFALAVKDARADSIVLSGPGGSLKVGRADANAYRGALADVGRLTRPGERVLFAPQLSALYALSGRADALPNISLLPGMLDGVPAERQAIARLAAAHVRVIVTDRHSFTEYGQGSFGTTFDRTLAAWVARNFERSGTYPGQSHTLVVWRRKTQ